MGSYDLGSRAKGVLGKGGVLLKDMKSAKRRIEFQQAQSRSWRAKPVNADVGLNKRQFQRVAVGQNTDPPCTYSHRSGHVALPLRASVSLSVKGLPLLFGTTGERSCGRWAALHQNLSSPAGSVDMRKLEI